MAYSIGPQAQGPDIHQIQNDIHANCRGVNKTTPMVLTATNRLVTATSYFQNDGQHPNSPSFPECNQRLREHLKNLLSTKISDRTVRQVSDSIDSSKFVTLDNVESAITALENARPEPEPPAKRPRLSLSSPPTDSEIEAAVGTYKKVDNATDDELIAKLNSWQREKAGDGNALHMLQNMLEYLAGQGFPLRAEMAKEAAEFPCGLRAYMLKTRPIRELRDKAKEFYTQGRRALEAKGSKEGIKDSFDLYRLILETKNFEEDQTCYLKSVTAVAGMRSSQGELSDYPQYPLYQLIPYLQYLIDHDYHDLATRGLLDTIERQLANLPVSDRCEYRQDSAAGAPCVNVRHSQRGWMVDNNHPPLNETQMTCFQRANPDTSAEYIEDLEYKVLSEGEVNQQLLEARGRARDCAHQQKTGREFPKEVAAINQEIAIPDFRSETFSHAGAACAKGERTSMEDAHSASRFNVRLSNGHHLDVSMTAVCDGHSANYAGHLASGYVINSLQTAISRRLVEFNPEGVTDQGVVNALTMACVDIDRSEYLFRGGIDYTGTTANIALIIGNRLWIVNVGDSRAILVLANDGQFIQASEDMKPGRDPFTGQANRCTQEAITRGGDLTDKDKKIVDPKRTVRLSTTHSFGNHSMGGVVSVRPDITSYSLDDYPDAVLVQTCDGITDVASSAQIASLVAELRNRHLSEKDIAELLVKSAYQARSGDNLTAVVSDINRLRGRS